MPTVIAIDPGPEESACVLWDGSRIISHGNYSNHELVHALEFWNIESPKWGGTAKEIHCAIEQIRGFGVMAGNGLFDTCHWTGRFLQAFGADRTTLVPRKVAAAHVCGTGGISKDQFVREAIIARFGGKDVAVGKKKSPGVLYGLSSHTWAAFAVALYWIDSNTLKIKGDNNV